MSDKTEKTVDVPRDTFVECPKIGMQLRRTQVCAACEFHKGLTERIGGDRPFHVRFMVGCSFTVARNIFAAEADTEVGDGHQ